MTISLPSRCQYCSPATTYASLSDRQNKSKEFIEQVEYVLKNEHTWAEYFIFYFGSQFFDKYLVTSALKLTQPNFQNLTFKKSIRIRRFPRIFILIPALQALENPTLWFGGFKAKPPRKLLPEERKASLKWFFLLATEIQFVFYIINGASYEAAQNHESTISQKIESADCRGMPDLIYVINSIVRLTIRNKNC